jgi:hypothetical protein
MDGTIWRWFDQLALSSCYGSPRMSPELRDPLRWILLGYVKLFGVMMGFDCTISGVRHCSTTSTSQFGMVFSEALCQ